MRQTRSVQIFDSIWAVFRITEYFKIFKIDFEFSWFIFFEFNISFLMKLFSVKPLLSLTPLPLQAVILLQAMIFPVILINLLYTNFGCSCNAELMSWVTTWLSTFFGPFLKMQWPAASWLHCEINTFSMCVCHKTIPVYNIIESGVKEHLLWFLFCFILSCCFPTLVDLWTWPGLLQFGFGVLLIDTFEY